jgi:hypothetical protein
MRGAGVRLTWASAAVIAILCLAAAAGADLLGLPADGSPVNSDSVNGIDPSQNAGESDVVGGSLAAGGARVPWATFEQKSGSARLIFARAFKNGQWVTQGKALNITPTVEAEAPSIDFAGAGRTVPWDAWYEPNAALGGAQQVFASRFNATAAAWIPEGQDRGSGVPSLNIHTGKDAENPSVAGGATVPGNAPVPWVAWQELDGSVGGGANHDQIFVSKGIKQAAPNAPCTGLKPSAAATVSNFCWQQVGLDRLAATGGSSATGDPTLNVDLSRDGVEPDIAFTGPGDKVPWVVWYEQGNSSIGLRNNEQVFAAKGVADATADGGFHWQAVGAGTTGQLNPLDTSGTNGFGPCAASTSAEDACSLNATPAHDAEDPQVAAGALSPGAPTVPWVVWAEDTGGGVHGIFVSRLVGGDHFVLFGGGAPISDPGQDATRPDITFFGNTPYVSWIEKFGGNFRGFAGHFDTTGAFVQDTPGGVKLLAPPRARAQLIDFRAPISSSCTADPFTQDGSTCPVAAVNSPFFLFTTSGTPQQLFAQAILGGISCVLFPGCTVAVKQNGDHAEISSDLGEDDTVGILVQRIVGTRRVHGATVFVLKPVGKVPLGLHRRGKVQIAWDLKVAGRPLVAGRYLIIMRGFDKRHNLLGVTKPFVFVVKR